MKRARLLPLSLLLFAGCASQATRVIWHIEPPQGMKASENVELLAAEPERPHELLAILEVSDHRDQRDPDAMRERLRAKAAEIGADAVVVAPATPRNAVSVSPWNVEHLYPKVLTGQAIRYLEKSGPAAR
jgi:hypothetical protein